MEQQDTETGKQIPRTRVEELVWVTRLELEDQACISGYIVCTLRRKKEPVHVLCLQSPSKFLNFIGDIGAVGRSSSTAQGSIPSLG